MASKNLSKKIIITPYHWPDLDGVASAYSLSQLLQKQGYSHAKSMIWKDPQPEALWVMKKFNIKIPQVDLKHDEEFILVDVSDPRDIPSFIPLNKVCAIIDHRKYFDLKSFPNAFAWISPVGSAATLVSQFYVKAKMQPDMLSAKILYLAIMSNTIKCKTHNTTLQDKIMANWLKEVGDIDENTVDEMFSAKSSFKDIKQKLDDDLSSKLQIIDGKQTAVAQLEMINVENFLKKHKSEVTGALKLLKEERKAESIFLVAIDLKNLKTFFYFLDDNDVYLIHKKIAIEPHDYYFMLNDILTRKEVIAMLQEYDNKKTYDM